MVSFRRSLGNNQNSNSATSPPAHAGIGPIGRPSEKVAPPQKVIRALKSHRSSNPQELSYTTGDFWYVTGEREGWYEALSEYCVLAQVTARSHDAFLLITDPLVGSRGLVPKADFEEFHKGGRASQSGSSRFVSYHVNKGNIANG